jgi:hypothetical protein
MKANVIVLSEHEGGGPPGTELARAPITVAVNTWVPLTMKVAADHITCTIGQVTVEGSSNAVLNGSIGFRSFDATFEADFLEVYDL